MLMPRWTHALAGALLFLGVSGFGFVPGRACETPPPAFERPQCEESELRSGVCISRDMPQALQETQSPEFAKYQATLIQQAQVYLEGLEPSSRKVVIADLDETLVDNADYYKRHGEFQPEAWAAWVAENKNGPYFPEALALLQEAKQRGFSVMFITGRPPELARTTLEQVSAIDWDGQFFKPSSIRVTSEEYKAQVRQLLRNLGYEIVLNIGDQPSDFDLPVEAEAGEFLLPNLLYSIP